MKKIQDADACSTIKDSHNRICKRSEYYPRNTQLGEECSIPITDGDGVAIVADPDGYAYKQVGGPDRLKTRIHDEEGKPLIVDEKGTVYRMRDIITRLRGAPLSAKEVEEIAKKY
ncbi:MAG: hypothetical protein GTN76_03935 [Candidatus Aenigmarchaeota archaeon]|nr:hypothetical protein [Candidatus Aenigmarchaeota archaeon]